MVYGVTVTLQFLELSFLVRIQVDQHNLLYRGANKPSINLICCKMAKRHDENKDLKSFGRIGKVDYSNKTLQASKSANIGIHLLGKIDFLTKYCGWHFIWNNAAGNSFGQFNSSDISSVKEHKKAKKSLN